MLVQVNDGCRRERDPRASARSRCSPTAARWATGTRTPRGGILARADYGDFNPERFVADDEILRDQITPRPAAAMPLMNVGDHVTSPLVGPLDYSFNNYKIQQLAAPRRSRPAGSRRRRRRPRDQELLRRHVQRREPRPERRAAVRPPRGPDRRQPSLAGPARDRGDPGQQRRDERRHGRRLPSPGRC